MNFPSIAIGSGGFWVLSAAARALPEPEAMGNRFYLWFYNFAHALLANFDKLGAPANVPPQGVKGMNAGQ
jgi:hypothetical protein